VSKVTKVRSHVRRTKSGKKTVVREHTREIKKDKLLYEAFNEDPVKNFKRFLKTDFYYTYPYSSYGIWFIGLMEEDNGKYSVVQFIYNPEKKFIEFMRLSPPLPLFDAEDKLYEILDNLKSRGIIFNKRIKEV